MHEQIVSEQEGVEEYVHLKSLEDEFEYMEVRSEKTTAYYNSQATDLLSQYN